MDLKLTTQDVWLSTVSFGVIGFVLLIPLTFVFRASETRATAQSLIIASAIFWGVLGSVAIFGFWGIYYQYFYPSWARWLAPLNLVSYAAIAYGMWWLSRQFPGLTILWFVLLGGVEGILEHLLGIYAFRILERVPWLDGITTFPVIVFSFCEYILYWSIVGWLALIILKTLMR